MRFCTLIRVAATFFIASLMGQTLGFTIPQQPLSQPASNTTNKLSTLQSKLTSRIIEHKSDMAVYWNDMSSNLGSISSSLDESSLILSDFKHQLPSLKEAQMPVFWNDMFSSLKVKGGELKQDVKNGLDNINQTLALMIKEIDDLDLFLSQVLEEITVLETGILKDAMSEQKSSKESNTVPSVYTGNLSSSKDDEKENLQAIFKHLLEKEHILTDAYGVVLSHHPANAISHARYTTTFNATLRYDTHACDYVCNGTAQVKFLQSASDNDGSIFEYEDVGMNCTAADPVEAINSVTSLHAGISGTSIWFEHP